MNKGVLPFAKMPQRIINFTKKPAYTKDSANPEKISTFYEFMKGQRSSPTFEKLASLDKEKSLPRYLQVFQLFYIIGNVQQNGNDYNWRRRT